MNIYLKLFLAITTTFYLVVSFCAWSITWASDCDVAPRMAFFVFDVIFFIGGAITIEDAVNDKKYKARN